MREPRGVLVSAAELAEVWGVPDYEVSGWIRHGCPEFDRDDAGRPLFDTAAVDGWRRVWRARLARRGHPPAAFRESATERMARRLVEVRAALRGQEPSPKA